VKTASTPVVQTEEEMPRLGMNSREVEGWLGTNTASHSKPRAYAEGGHARS